MCVHELSCLSSSVKGNGKESLYEKSNFDKTLHKAQNFRPVVEDEIGDPFSENVEVGIQKIAVYLYMRMFLKLQLL